MSYRSKPDKHKAAVFVSVILYKQDNYCIINLYKYAIYYCFRCVQTISMLSDLVLLRSLSSECVSQTPLFQRSNGKSTYTRWSVVVVGTIAVYIIIDNTNYQKEVPYLNRNIMGSSNGPRNSFMSETEQRLVRDGQYFAKREPWTTSSFLQ